MRSGRCLKVLDTLRRARGEVVGVGRLGGEKSCRAFPQYSSFFRGWAKL